MKLSKGWIILIVVAVLAFLLFTWVTGINNSLVAKEESVNKAWSNVEAQYQRRFDVIPNLVNTVKGVANFEQQTLTAVIEARSKASSVQINPKNLDDASLKKFEQAQEGVKSAIGNVMSRLMVVVEKYPDLKATQNFSELQAQIEGTENRINVARRDFNEEAQSYNTYLRSFPNSMFAGMFGFQKKAYFQSQAGSEKAPEVKF